MISRFTFCIISTSLGVDSVAAAVKFMEEVRQGKIKCNKVILLVNRTPLSHLQLEYYAEILADRLGIEELRILEPVCDAYAPPICRFCWKMKPLQNFLRSLPGYPTRYILIVTGQRRSESVIRSRLGKWSTLFGVSIYRPVYDYPKVACRDIAKRIMPELEPVWREIAQKNGGHTSLDCVTCLRRAKTRFLLSP